jgi:3',5'-cyclic AMP phosphodiesterase CpdA
MASSARTWSWLTAFVIAAAAGCGADDDAAGVEGPAAPPQDRPAAGSPDGELSPEQLRERPWEILSRKGESLLSNVFYADDSENEQIMPWAIDGRVVIDRLVYPTLGNPNLYVKDDAEDELVVVLRIEDDAIAHLSPSLQPVEDSNLRRLIVKSDAADGLDFFLVARSERAAATESDAPQAARSGVYKVEPTLLLVSPEPDGMPAVLRRRKTVRAVFDREAMKGVPAGLYDARFEVRKRGGIFANVYEYQYNAVRVFDTASDEYTALNVTDTQVSIGPVYQTLTADKIDDFVAGVNASNDPAVRSAAFITFNGDLHNGGSPETVRQRAVAHTYKDEAKRVLGALKNLDFPIFLTAGNHDGYAALGHVPSAIASADRLVGDSLEKVVREQNNKAWPDFSWSEYQAFLAKTDQQREGLHLDLFSGGFVRARGEAFSEAFKEVPRSDRNILLYDGFYQWQKTYGPLYGSWSFGKNRYVSMNSYELRQHRRTGWGMYTVNYGGAISEVQMDWLDRELGRAKARDEDVVVLMHHDPRGGHKGKDLGYYFPMLAYKSVQQSTLNYILSEVFTPLVCKQPSWSLSVDDRNSCLHDGLQEWMGPDEEFEKKPNGYFLSGVEVLSRIAKSPQVRTLLIGHAHFNTLEVMQDGDELIPNRLSMDDPESAGRTASLEAANPVRRFAWEAALDPAAVAERGGDSDAPPGEPAPETLLTPESFRAWRVRLDGMLRDASAGAMRTLEGTMPDGPRELAILRLTSGADLTSQKYGSKEMYGWSVLHVTRATGMPRINQLTYYIHEASGGAFSEVTTVGIDRTKSIAVRAPDNPVAQLFDW